MTGSAVEPQGVAIFGVGAVGQAIAGLLLERGWPLVAAVNRAGAKVGQDLGTMMGLDAPLGVTVADAAETELETLGADIAIVAVHDDLATNAPHHRRLLESGLNVICLGGESSYPRAVDSDVAESLHDLAVANGVTFTGCGLWDAYRLSTVKALAGPCTALRGVHHQSVTDAARFGGEVLRLAKVGEDPADLRDDQAGGEDGPDRSLYQVVLHQAVESLGLEVTDVSVSQAAVTLDQTVEAPGIGPVERGRCVGMRSTIDIKTHEGVQARADIELRLTLPDEGEWMSWTIDGDPPAQMRLEGLDTGHATASSAVNRIPDVLAASPGLVTVDELAPMNSNIPRGERR